VETMTINKIIAAVLLALLVAKASDILGDMPFHAEAPEQPAYAVALPEDEADGAAEEADEPAGPSLAALLADASADAGERAFRKCSACHTVEQGGANRVGPNLYDVVGADVGHIDAFNYSGPVNDFGGKWSYERLDSWLEAPNDLIPGNRMAFAGVGDPEERADLIAYMRANTENPPPLPEPEEDAGETTEAPAASEPAGDETEAESAGRDEADETSEDAAAQEVRDEGEADASPLETALREASAERGQRIFNQCSACHTVEEGAGNRVGPNLYNVVGTETARRDDFNYSGAFSQLDGHWSYERLSELLENPMDMVPGTRMAFAGLKDVQERADVIAYLRQYSDDPPPLPGEDDAGE